MAMHILENESLRIGVADAGAELSSVYDKENEAERLWGADPAVWNRHAPILFPFVGRVYRKTYRVDGKEYSMTTQHGFARDLDFVCTEESAESVCHVLTATEGTKAVYPWDFRLQVRHRLDAADSRLLHIAWDVTNTGEGTMVYSIGGHPGFLMPQGVKKEDCRIAFPGRDSLRYFGASAAGFGLPGQQKTLPLENGSAPYAEDIPETWIFEGQHVDSVQILRPEGSPWVSLDCPAFPILAVWANPAGPFICLEPWFGRCDDEGFAGDISEKPFVEKLGPGETKHIEYSIEFHR